MDNVISLAAARAAADLGPNYPIPYNELTVEQIIPQIAGIWEEIDKIPHKRYGVCRFCGQVKDMPDAGYSLQKDLDEIATRQCECLDAKSYAADLRRERERIEKRLTAQEQAEDAIDEMFGEQAPGYGKITIKEDTRAHILQTAMMVYDRKMRGATIEVTDGIKVKISRSAKDILKIKRADSSEWEQEIE
ncbi:hypothetical protein [Anaerotruncus rubiinfantis]|uniref:hypothetical protein n=1 Tax=Anaerotruncus rubiinfantis TaxID=1720200 RepID=UPI003D7B31CC